MKRVYLLQAAAAALLLLAVIVYAGRVLELTGPFAVDAGGRAPASLSPATRALLAGLEQRLSLTYLVSPRRQMPSRLKRVEAGVRQLLEALRDANPDRVEFRIVDPASSDAQGAAYAARRRASPVRVARVEGDEHGEAEVWSSLVLALEGHPDVLIQDIEAAHLPHLEGLVAEHLRALRQPVTPTFALCAPPGYEQLPRLLSQHGPVVEIDLSDARALPRDVDLLVWVQPRRTTPAHVQALRQFLASGRSVVLAGSALQARYELAPYGGPGHTSPADALRAVIAPAGSAWADLLEPFGLRPLPDLILDRNTGPVTVAVEDGTPRQVEWPLHLRNLPAFRDFRRFRTPARGGLSFALASPLEVDVGRALEAGFHPAAVATTTEHTRALPLPDRPLTRADLTRASQTGGAPVAKQNLMVLLSPDDPWSGQVLVLASASALRDGTVDLPGYGHAVLVRDLVRTFCDSERLVRLRVDRRPPPPLAPVGNAARVLWRLVAVLAGPLAFAALGLARRRTRPLPERGETERPTPTPPRLGALSRPARHMGAATAALAALLTTGALAWWGYPHFDWTRSRANTPDPAVVAELTRCAGQLQCTLVQSPPGALPARLRTVRARLEQRLRAAGVDLQIVHPEALPAARRQVLATAGLGPFAAERVLADTSVTTPVWSGLLLRLGQRQTTVPRLDAASVEHVDFLLAAALRRLETGRAPVVAVLSDLPRLSPAEALEDYQRQGLSAPQGVDVYSRARTLLGEYGYDVRHVSLREPRLPAGADRPDAVVWFQPRRDAGPLIEQVSAYLAGGGKAVVALQHYNIQQRQYRGAGFETVYWPQPQFQDLERYLELFGVSQPREVLMDRTRHHLRLDTQVNRSALREYDPQQVALPFLIRAVPAHYDAQSPLTAGLGDLLFPWGNRFAWNEAALTAAGVEARVLVTTSERSWSYDWRGGWLPPEALDPGERTGGAQPLAVVLEGPLPAARVDEESGDLVAANAAGNPPAWLCLVGSSEMFKNQRLHLTGFDHAQLLLNAVALAAHGEDLAHVQARHPVAPGFAYLPAQAKARWRFAVLVAGPLAIFGLGLGVRRRRGGKAT